MNEPLAHAKTEYGHDAVTAERFPAVEKRQLNERADTDDVACDLLRHLGRRPHRPRDVHALPAAGSVPDWFDPAFAIPVSVSLAARHLFTWGRLKQ